ncbi:2-succinyl-5-enolpyruvyl-6-hydroxy-3-cyclohexene-1-carboxylic-acid synthase [Coraliomargarita sp. SDUM461004]|uniref:2-succinyl-5-enolpyruvyl-6-hydroxy-3-cyclohexene-1-carboxylate synthase n=1 Tax=Thalassobacterium sedimentorum TaxID=3041258 RepID=A0ABU1AH86_9BACT|nr:2-succinyl-5-enolpyruvyl-6-hydroxy-3-cyclohexene-1-carboxylic-acid synthase [Coraliomargarita sp. SDUM461004]MDQ8194187.1 2-succinyl-5-enolpyruvyl-6-hydroxy-3-cyclohexene-1-carboxylic-acid synthase [Coraliomargarita sp. SDUM461004]
MMLLPETEPFDVIARSNVNSAWGALTVEVLARLGVQTIVTSPGSRSTPLTIAAARNARIEALTVLDERSAAFYALGLAKRSRRPVALVCTSGSAAVNYWPAVLEASMSGTPLLLLTADRPPELRDCSSGQSIDQLKLYGNHVRHFSELALPESTPAMLAYLRQTLVHAVSISLGANAGPVHLNVPFRDPLAPSLEAGPPVVDAATLAEAATVSTRPCEAVLTGGGIDLVAIERLSSHSRGLIIVGAENPRCSDEAFADAVAMISAKLGWPVLADVLNPLRNHASQNSALITRYDTFLRHLSDEESLRPSAILQIGSLPTSKVLRAWLGSLDTASFLLTSRPINTDPLHRRATPLYGETHLLAEQLQDQRSDPTWAKQWSSLELKTSRALDEKMTALDSLFEGKVAWLLSRYLPFKTNVFLASSMSVRYAEYFWMAGDRGCAVFCNRGANGIDGTLSTALGVAHAGESAVLLTGDLAFLHDTNGLMAASQLRGGLTVVLVNNNGGGIFEHLPVAQMDAAFESYFATPQNVDFAQLCAAYGVRYERIIDWAHFTDALSSAFVSGIRVLELQSDRKADRHKLLELLAIPVEVS